MLTFQELYESYVDDVYRFSLWLSGDRFEAEDITSDTFIRAWVSKRRIRTETLKAYLFAIARNLFLEKQRKKNRQVTLVDIYPHQAPEPDDVIDSRKELLRVQKILQTFPEVDRAAFIMRVQHELPYAEIARVIGLSLTATKVKVHRVRKKLLTTCVDKEDNHI